MKDIEYLTHIITPLVAHPDELEITRSTDEMGVLLTVKCHKDDFGRIVGRSGNTALALRTLLRVYGQTRSARISLQVLDPLKGYEDKSQTASSKQGSKKSIDEAMENLDTL